MAKQPGMNLDAIAPLFAPWEEPTAHRVRSDDGGPAKVVSRRRPSTKAVVNTLRDLVRDWREDGYVGVSHTTRTLLNYWFERTHTLEGRNGQTFEFRYYFCQREAVETFVFLKEVWKTDRVSQILDQFGSDQDKVAAYGISDEDDAWGRAAFKMATGSGKTKAMALCIAWSYFHAQFESESPMARHFVVIAPGLTVYERLKDDFGNGRIFDTDPIIPPEWKGDWNISVVEQDAAGGAATGGVIYLTNIHRLYDTSKRKGKKDADYADFMGPSVNKATALDTSAQLRDRITAHNSILVLNDEAHHVWDPENAWNEALHALHNGCKARGGAGIVNQLDFSATPKDNTARLFRHVVCDTPLGEAVDGGIVKFPIIGKASNLAAGPSQNAGYKYGTHLKLGYERWKVKHEEWKKAGKKALLFVMCESTQAADEITGRLNDDKENFPLLKGRTINLHTNLKGRVVLRGQGDDRVPVFEEKESEISDEDLKALRKLSRELDNGESPYLCIVSVLMLREGWDVKNVTTIVPLRQYSADSGILAEQTLGRGLRRMTGPGAPGGVIETVTVIDHPAFASLYQQELESEGLFPEVVDADSTEPTTVDIFVDTKKNTAALEIVLPSISGAHAIKPKVAGLSVEDVRKRFEPMEKLPLGKKTDRVVDFEGRALTTGEVIEKLRIDLPQLYTSLQAISYYVQLIEAECKVPNLHAALAAHLQMAVEELLFTEKVTLFDPRLVQRLADADVVTHVLRGFVPLVRQLTVTTTARTSDGTSTALSTWKLFKASHSDRNPCRPAAKTMFNLVPCRGGLEAVLVPFLDLADNGVAAFAKNTGPQALRIDYVRSNGQLSTYTPDFIVRGTNGMMYLVETKGREDADVARKARAAIGWCDAASTDVKWTFVYVPEHASGAMGSGKWQTLLGASTATLDALLNQEEMEADAPLFASILSANPDPAVKKLIPCEALEALPEFARKSVDEALLMFDFLVKRPNANLAPAFTGLLGMLDRASKRLVQSHLLPTVPAFPQDQKAFFAPYLVQGNMPREHYDRLAKNLRKTLLFDAGLMPIGLLRDCLSYALEDTAQHTGVFEAVRGQFTSADAPSLLKDVSHIYAFRNQYIAHQNAELTDKELAERELVNWINGIGKIVKMIPH